MDNDNERDKYMWLYVRSVIKRIFLEYFCLDSISSKCGVEMDIQK